LDPLVPNQVRYQTAPHSDKNIIIVRKNRTPADQFIFFASAAKASGQTDKMKDQAAYGMNRKQGYRLRIVHSFYFPDIAQ
jgi:hypothetical protein